MWRTAAILPSREPSRFVAASGRDEFSPAPSDPPPGLLAGRIPTDEARWHRVWRVAPRRRMTLVKTLTPGLVTVIVSGCRFPWQTLADVERRLFGTSWDDRL